MGLRFREDGTFKIVQLTDLHIGGNPEQEEDVKTCKRIDKVIEAEMPDLIAITDDLIWGTADHADQSYRRLLDHIDKWNIPFAIVYGNHDSEGRISREELLDIQKEYSNSLAKRGPDEARIRRLAADLFLCMSPPDKKRLSRL